MFSNVWSITPLHRTTFDSPEFFSTIGLDFFKFLQKILYALMPFCCKDLSILNDVPTLKNIPTGEIEITRHDFGAIFIVLSRNKCI